ncbi:hypothetical protein MMIC_P2220 [Mariprofundus micogutta]|uniref:Transposase n=1 Tax=Mariprofundus micogutta TaxID=1921010 RepID=A0A1L8CQP5_9PROT|nr:hypothetical protein MMIC_P2220 [Mariprofundus micogutta]
MVNPYERRQGELRLGKRRPLGGATLNESIWNAARRERQFLYAAALFLAEVQRAHCSRNALWHTKIAISLRPESVLAGPE